ncbi:hypothetical protein [Streptomyces sp. NPDC093111]|uniref:hypothetical protein n=1 Tax=Streptomyces sp. NPDC093111 TaxID=3154978 RepID=UPI003420615A
MKSTLKGKPARLHVALFDGLDRAPASRASTRTTRRRPAARRHQAQAGTRRRQ